MRRAQSCWTRPITCSSLPTTRASERVIRSRPTTASPTTIPTRTMAPSASSPCRLAGPWLSIRASSMIFFNPFRLFDNFYDPSRQGADGHQWITEGLAPYADDIQSPDWNRSYPGGNGGDALAYHNKGFLFSEASAAGLPVKLYGEYVENDTFTQPNGSHNEPS